MKSKIDVIQIHRSMKMFTKQNYTSENREDFWSSSKVFNSEIGYFNEGILFLPLEHKTTPNLHGCQLVILIDGLGFEYDSIVAEIKVYGGIKYQKELELFKIQKMKSGSYELSLNYKTYTWNGTPERNNHKICEMLVGQIIRYQLNWKHNYKERNYYEVDYHVEFVGQATSIEFRKAREITQLKKNRSENCKFINERKILY